MPPARPGALDRGRVDRDQLDVRRGAPPRRRPARPRAWSARRPRGSCRGAASASLPTVPGASPSDAADDVSTTLGTPARAAARTAVSAPRTLTWKSAAGSVGHSVLMPATWIDERAARHAGRHRVLVQDVAAHHGAPRAASARSAASERASATTSSPRSTRRVGERAADQPAAPRQEDAGHVSASPRATSGIARTR